MTHNGPPDLKAETHPSRHAQRQVLDGQLGGEEGWSRLRTIYAEQAPEWRDWTQLQPGYAQSVADGLREVKDAPWAVEVCCGTGEATSEVRARFTKVVACDVNLAMLRGRDTGAPQDGVVWIAADVRSLPFADRSVPLMVALNGVFNPEEIERVIVPGGQVLWCTSFREGTPLYVSPGEMGDRLGSGWTGRTGLSGFGQWTLLTRTE
ncbi:class I SAM-dependent methyltransferase [Streptomyces sp. NPDC050418]|uniref:class I SAM-dependent methyltransferase n=1 Tax=Streptomyces sp. NPDC050418 TaxID=3365612 RepID=UPI0037BB9C65